MRKYYAIFSLLLLLPSKDFSQHIVTFYFIFYFIFYFSDATPSGPIYDNPRPNNEVTYDIPSSSSTSSGSTKFATLFSNPDPWTPDPFIGNRNSESIVPFGRQSSSNTTDANGYEIPTSITDTTDSDQEEQEDIIKLRQEVQDFLLSKDMNNSMSESTET